MTRHAYRSSLILALGLAAGCGADGEDGAVGITSSAGQATESESATGAGSAGGWTTGSSGGSGGTSGGGSSDSDDSAGSAGGGPKFDVGVPDGGADDSGGEETVTGYIWIANSGQQPATVSKINTETMIEEGRYMTRPDGKGSPSRTSVNLNGNMAVANRQGGVTKILGTVSKCPDENANGKVDTSKGAFDIKQWGQDECVVWHTPLLCSSNRPMAWTQGQYDAQTDTYLNPKLWTACDSEVLRLDGDTGAVEDTVPMPDAGLYYGGAVDGNGNLWLVNTGTGSLYRVDFVTLAVNKWTPPAGPTYGLAVDSKGRPWLCGGGHASRFEPGPEIWTHTPNASGGNGGCMTDGMGTLYHGNPQGVMQAIDTETVMPIAEFPLPAYVHGVSVDFSGRVWGVTLNGTKAFRLDVTNGWVDTFDGLVSAYTYSDMTGFALSVAGNPTG